MIVRRIIVTNKYVSRTRRIMMKKYLVLSLVALVLLLSGCTSDQGENPDHQNPNEVQKEQAKQDKPEKPVEQEVEQETETPKESEKETITISDYYPMGENVRYVYEGIGNEYASYDVYHDYVSDHKVQQRVNNGGTVLARIVEIKDGKLIKTFSREETYYRENLLASENGEEEVLLMEPLKTGTTWKLTDSRVRTITNLSAEVSTPSGNYQAIEVSTEGPNGRALDYYAHGIGLVKSIFSSEGMEVSSSLSKIEENVPLVQTISFYYPNNDDYRLEVVNKEISFHTNDITRKVLEQAYKPVLTENTKINSLYLNQDNNVYIDLNEAFLTEMIAGSGMEGAIVQSIVNTFGHYYGVEKVSLTIDNEPYSSGHIEMEKGEFFNVTPVE